VLPQELVRIDIRLSFRVDPVINYMFRQIVGDLVKNREIDITSRYESLRGQDMVGDFQFVLLNKIVPYQLFLRGWQRMALRLHGWLKWLGVSDQESFGLDNSTFTVENVPPAARASAGAGGVKTYPSRTVLPRQARQDRSAFRHSRATPFGPGFRPRLRRRAPGYGPARAGRA